MSLLVKLGLLAVGAALVAESLPLQKDLSINASAIAEGWSGCTRKHALFVKLWSLIFYLDNVSFAGLQKRPIYNVAHMVNGNNELNKVWVKYGNALESDLQFNADGIPRRFYHGFPCDTISRNC